MKSKKEIKKLLKELKFCRKSLNEVLDKIENLESEQNVEVRIEFDGRGS